MNFFFAQHTQPLEQIQELISSKNDINQLDYAGTPLHMAIYFHPKAIHLLITDNRVDVNKMNNVGYIALIIAIRRRRGLSHFLTLPEIKLNIQDINGNIALHHAVQIQNIFAIYQLLVSPKFKKWFRL